MLHGSSFPSSLLTAMYGIFTPDAAQASCTPPDIRVFTSRKYGTPRRYLNWILNGASSGKRLWNALHIFSISSGYTTCSVRVVPFILGIIMSPVVGQIRHNYHLREAFDLRHRSECIAVGHTCVLTLEQCRIALPAVVDESEALAALILLELEADLVEVLLQLAVCLCELRRVRDYAVLGYLYFRAVSKKPVSLGLAVERIYQLIRVDHKLHADVGEFLSAAAYGEKIPARHKNADAVLAAEAEAEVHIFVLAEHGLAVPFVAYDTIGRELVLVAADDGNRGVRLLYH